MRLRRFLMSDPMKVGRLAEEGPITYMHTDRFLDRLVDMSGSRPLAEESKNSALVGFDQRYR